MAAFTRVLLVASALLVGAATAPRTAAAEEPGITLAAGLAAKIDGSNPATTQLLYLPLQLQLGYDVGAGGRVFVTSGLGAILGDEATGRVLELGGGVGWRWCRAGGPCAGVALAVAWSHADYEFKQVATVTDGIAIEPELQVEWRVGERVSIAVAAVGRVERLIGDVRYVPADASTGPPVSRPAGADRPPHLGGGLAVRVLYSF